MTTKTASPPDSLLGALCSADAPSAVLTYSLLALAKRLRADTIWLVEVQGDELEARRLGPGDDAPVRVDLPDGVARSLQGLGDRFITRDVASDMLLAPLASTLGGRALAVLSLSLEGASAAWLVGSSGEPGRFAASRLRAAEPALKIFTQAFDMARATEQLRGEVLELREAVVSAPPHPELPVALLSDEPEEDEGEDGDEGEDLREAFQEELDRLIRERNEAREHATLLAQTSTLASPGIACRTWDGRWKTLDEIQREHIEQTLVVTSGQVAGRTGATELLKLASGTLRSTMKRVGVRRNGD